MRVQLLQLSFAGGNRTAHLLVEFYVRCSPLLLCFFIFSSPSHGADAAVASAVAAAFSAAAVAFAVRAEPESLESR
eukprot:847832-Rhodomonas_salina.1